MAKDALRFLGDEAGRVNCTCDILDKDAAIFNYIQYMFDRTNCMFRYTGLPDTIPEPMLEYMLQIYGSVAIIEYDGNVYAMRAQFGGPPDPYYRPTQCVIANPALGMSNTFKIINHLPPFDKTTWSEMPTAVRFLNDSQIQGLLPMFSRYAVQMAENDVSIRSAQINLRQQTLIVADTGPEFESALAYMRSLEDGKLAAIAKRPFLEGVKVTNASGGGQTNLVTQLLELQQYLKASWYNEIGLNSNFNMKSQYVSSEELNSTADIMLPLIDNMYEQRKSAVEIINQTFNLEITVEKSSAWEKKQIQADLATGSDSDSTDLPPSIEIQDTQPIDESPVESTRIDDTNDDEVQKEEENPIDVIDQSIMDAIHQAAVEAVDEILDSVETPDVTVNVNIGDDQIEVKEEIQDDNPAGDPETDDT